MSKGKPRHNPNKKANLKGSWCDCCERLTDGLNCEVGVPRHVVETVCKGNPHNCCKVVFRKWAGKPENAGVPHVPNKFDNY